MSMAFTFAHHRGFGNSLTWNLSWGQRKFSNIDVMWDMMWYNAYMYKKVWFDLMTWYFDVIWLSIKIWFGICMTDIFVVCKPPVTSKKYIHSVTTKTLLQHGYCSIEIWSWSFFVQPLNIFFSNLFWTTKRGNQLKCFRVCFMRVVFKCVESHCCENSWWFDGYFHQRSLHLPSLIGI